MAVEVVDIRKDEDMICALLKGRGVETPVWLSELYIIIICGREGD